MYNLLFYISITKLVKLVRNLISSNPSFENYLVNYGCLNFLLAPPLHKLTFNTYSAMDSFTFQIE